MQNSYLIFFMVSIRIIAMFMASPVFSVRQIPSLVKVGLSVILGFLLAGMIDTTSIVIPSTGILFLMVIAKEIIVGASIGFIANLIFSAIRVSAQFMDFSIGFSMAQYYDPTTAGNSTPLERFFNWFALVIFLTFNFHHIIISAVIKSFEVIPVGIFSISSNFAVVIMNTFNSSFYLAMQLAAPIIIILFFTDFTMGLIARTVPQLNIFILGMPLKVLVGLLAISTILPGLTHMYIKSFESMSGNFIKFFNVFPMIFLMGSDDKTEDPTSKKLSEARKKGQVPKSVDLNSAVVLLGATIMLITFGDLFYIKGREFMIESFNYVTKNDMSLGQVFHLYLFMLKNGLIASMPIILTIMVLGIIANIAQVGFMTSAEGLKPQLSKLNPLEGFKKFFSKRSLMELFKSLAKINFIGYIAYSYVKSNMFDILKTSDLNPKGIFAFVKSLTDGQLKRLVMVMFTIAFADFVFQRMQFKKDMKMTKQEVKEEYKQMEGDPQIKSKIKQRQREMAMKRMMNDVPKATVVVTNPTHFAVALKYEKNVTSAPKVIAKGADLVAFRIKEIAKENNIPIVENKILARALFAKVEIDQDIPMDLYQTVAEIIAYVYSIKKM